MLSDVWKTDSRAAWSDDQNHKSGGRITLPSLGLSGTDLELLIDKVSAVFNSAATVRFNKDLRTAVQLNVKGPQELLHICQQMKTPRRISLFFILIKFNSFLFNQLSTASNNLDKDRIEEIVYPPPISPAKLLQILDDDSLKKYPISIIFNILWALLIILFWYII